MMRASGTRNISVPFAAISVVVVPFIFAKILWYIYLVGYHLPLSQLVTVSDVIILVLQLVVAFSVFYKLQREDDTFGLWFMWGACGCIVIYFVVPYIVRLVIPGL